MPMSSKMLNVSSEKLEEARNLYRQHILHLPLQKPRYLQVTYCPWFFLAQWNPFFLFEVFNMLRHEQRKRANSIYERFWKLKGWFKLSDRSITERLHIAVQSSAWHNCFQKSICWLLLLPRIFVFHVIVFIPDLYFNSFKALGEKSTPLFQLRTLLAPPYTILHPVELLGEKSMSQVTVCNTKMSH